jgi:hypothetical protein
MANPFNESYNRDAEQRWAGSSLPRRLTRSPIVAPPSEGQPLDILP